MRFLIQCDRLMHNFLHKKLHGEPLSAADPVGFYLFLLSQTVKRGDSKPDTKYMLHYPAEIEGYVHPSRAVGLLNANENEMLRAYTKYCLLSELMVLLDESDNYNDTFFDFQEHYNLSELDMSRDEMYKWYERIQSGFTRHQFLMPAMLPLIGWPPDHLG